MKPAHPQSSDASPSRTPGVAVTGAGSGLGRALAFRFAAAGWRVAVTDIDPHRADETLSGLKAMGGEGLAMALDVTKSSDWEKLHGRLEKDWGGLDVLINNAGVATAGTVAETSLEDWRWVMEIDLIGVVMGCRQFAGDMARRGNGYIINVASFAGLAGAPGISSYGVAKAGVIALSEALRVEMASSGVGVTVVCPAFVKTRLAESMRVTVPGTQARVERWMDRANITAEEVAERTFAAMQKRRFLLLTHPQTRWAWRLKRWFPGLYFGFMARQLRAVSKRR